jgi:hypothetical protein
MDKVTVSLNLDQDVVAGVDSIVAAHNAKRVRTSRSAIANSILANKVCGDQSRPPVDQPTQEGTCQSNPTS